MYSGCVVTVTNLRKHPNADRLQIVKIAGNNVIVDDTCVIGQRLVYFPVGGVLDERFARENNLLRVMSGGKNVSGGYLDPETRIVKPEKLRGEISEGLALPIEVLNKYTDIDKLKNGDRICVLNGYRLCYPYVPKGMVIDFENRVLKHTFPPLKNSNNVIIPWGIRVIGDYAFCGCKKLKTVIIPNNVTTIGHHAFEICESLQAIKIPDSVTSIAFNAFDGCLSLSTVKVPKNINLQDLCKLLDDPRFDIEAVNPNGKLFTIWDGVVFDKGMTELIRYPKTKKDMFYFIPDGVKTIRESAFFDNKYLVKVIIPDSVTRINHRAFEYCKRLTSVAIPPSVTYMGNFVFLGICNVPNKKTKRIKGDIMNAKVSDIISALDSLSCSEGVLIRGQKGSEAERYAKINGIAFEEII